MPARTAPFGQSGGHILVHRILVGQRSRLEQRHRLRDSGGLASQQPWNGLGREQRHGRRLPGNASCVAYVGISYLSQALSDGLGEAMLENAANHYLLPTASPISSAAAAFASVTPTDREDQLAALPASRGDGPPSAGRRLRPAWEERI